MSYKKLIIKSTAAIEIEEVIAYYCEINKTIAKKLEKEIRNCFVKISKNPESFQFRYQNHPSYMVNKISLWNLLFV